MRAAEGSVLDLDGTVFFGDEAIPGAADTIEQLRRAGVPMCFATNTTRRPRSDLVSRLASMGIEVTAEELFTAPVAAARWLAGVGATRVSLLLAEPTFEEFEGFTLDDEKPDYVVVGDLGEEWTFGRLNLAFRALKRGAALVAIQKNRFWDPGGGLCLDAGPFVAALEYASERDAVLVGKPSTPFFVSARRLSRCSARSSRRRGRQCGERCRRRPACGLPRRGGSNGHVPGRTPRRPGTTTGRGPRFDR